MKIRPKNIPMFQNGGVPQWYLDRYGNRISLLGWDLNKRYNFSNENLNANDHRNAGNLDTVYRKNIAYIGTPGAISSDIQSFYNSDGKGMSAEDFVKFYNENAEKIRLHWAKDLTYNAKTAGDHNKLFKRMFNSRSDLSNDTRSEYNIGYLDNLEDVEGSSTWLRRMDLYEHDFDFSNPDKNRLHEITLSNGNKAVVYKKANGDIGLFNTTEGAEKVPSNQNDSNPNNSNPNDSEDSGTQVPTGHKEYGFDWNKVKEAATGILNNPNLYATGRLIGLLINNGRIYDAALKGIRPDLKLTYYTHRQVVGDEATKQAYYRRAAQGQTKAALPFTSDADRQMAYQYEAKRIGDELRALGDLADNQEIRRTSDESNQHQWANTQRATEVANANIAALNLANSLKQNLLALKYASNWASIDNYLKGIEYRKRQQLAEQEAIKDLMFALDHSGYLYTPEYLAAYKKLEDVLEKHKKSDNTYDKTHPDVIKARAEFDKYLKEVQRKQLLDLLDYKNSKIGISWGKSGVKITRKKKDDLLYKSTKDTVDHFRKMSKISSDALNRKKPKIEKLAPHPKGSTRKYLLGGVAPFGVYTPVALGGETTTSSQTSTSSTGKSSKSDSGKDTLDLIKTLFSKVTDKALPIDANLIYSSMNNLLSKYEMFGLELSTSDIASMYLSSMQQIVGLLHSKEVHEKAKALATLNDALNEFAVTATGNYILLNTETGKLIESKSLEKKGYTPITNQHLLYLREYSPDLALSTGDRWIENVINNGMGINKIGALIKALAGNIGSSESKLEGFSKVESDKIKSGLRELAEAPAGDYKITELNKNSNALIQAAFKYIQNMLSPSLKAILEAHGGVKENIAYFLSSLADDVHHVELDPLTGKAAKDSNGNSKEGLEINSAVQLLLGMSSPRDVNFNIGNGNSFSGFGRISSINDVEEKPFGADFSYADVYKSSLRKNLDLDNACFGDVPINKALKDRIIIDNSTVTGVDLPYTVDKNGRIIPDFKLLERIEEADKEAMLKGINPETNPQEINAIYIKHKLPIKYGANNLLTNNYRRFAVILATAIEDVFLDKSGLASNGTLTLVSDENEIDKYLEEIKKITGKKNIDGDKDIYKGSIFIPIIGDLTDAISSSKTGKLTENNYSDYRDKWATKNYTKPQEENFSK